MSVQCAEAPLIKVTSYFMHGLVEAQLFLAQILVYYHSLTISFSACKTFCGMPVKFIQASAPIA